MLARVSLPVPLLGRLAAIRLFSSPSNGPVKEFIDKVVKDNDVVIFMKGTPDKPMCGFSRAACQILDLQGVKRITAINVLEDEDIRTGVKSYTSWPTIPQVFIKGNFIGGTDILKDMHLNGQLGSLLQREKLIYTEEGNETECEGANGEGSGSTK